MKFFTEIIALGVLSYLLFDIFTPVFRKLAQEFSLLDQPNYRKIHGTPVPLIGGIVLGFILLLLGGISLYKAEKELSIVLFGSFVLLIVGIVDDKKDVRALYKLVIQLLISYIIAVYGIRITSLYGLFGIWEISVFWQYFLTIIVITLAVNAFNLMDGTDGLAASIAITGFSFLGIISLLIKDDSLSKISMILVGGLFSFIKFNYSKKNKIFLGDSGSLFLGFLLVTLGIYYLGNSFTKESNHLGISYLLLVFLLPVFDVGRVFIQRLLKKRSPFKPDKTHLHHFLLQLGFSHKNIVFYVLVMNIILLVFTSIMMKFQNLNAIFLSVFLVYLSYKILLVFNHFNKWKEKIKMLENRK